MFLAVGIILLIISIIEFLFNKDFKIIFLILAILLTSMVCLRYGQGTDYYGYYYNYNLIKDVGIELTNTISHGELFWRVIQSLFKQFGLKYELFIFFIALISMIITIKTIYKYSPYKVISLFFLYPTYYLTYYFSAIREGIAIAVFLGIGIELLKKHNYFKYTFLIIILSLIHSSAIILICLPFLLNNSNKYLKMSIVLIVLLPLLYITGLFGEIGLSINKGTHYSSINISFLGIAIRTVFFTIIYILHRTNKENDKTEIFYKIYKYGFIISILLSFNSLISQRMTAYFKVTEIILIPLLLYNNSLLSKNRLLLFMILLAASTIEIYKNLNSYIIQGNYYSNIKPYNMPYVSVFNKEKINNYCNPYYMKYVE